MHLCNSLSLPPPPPNAIICLSPFLRQHWPCRGPITSLFWSYLGARCIPWPSKLQMAGYLGTYLAMAYSVVGICSYIVLRMFYGVLQARKAFFFFHFRVIAIMIVLHNRGENR